MQVLVFKIAKKKYKVVAVTNARVKCVGYFKTRKKANDVVDKIQELNIPINELYENMFNK